MAEDCPWTQYKFLNSDQVGVFFSQPVITCECKGKKKRRCEQSQKPVAAPRDGLGPRLRDGHWPHCTAVKSLWVSDRTDFASTRVACSST